MVPTELRYTKEHEWVRVEGDVATVGVTQYAADQLGDVVFVDLPEAGRALDQFGTFGVVESVKAASDVYAPVTGKVISVNSALSDKPETINEDAYGEGWIYVVKPSNLTEESEELLDPDAYAELIESEEH